MADIIKKITEILNGREKITLPAIVSKWQNIYYNISVHTTGVCPSYIPLRWENSAWTLAGGATVYPVYWIYPQYDLVFDRLFSAHPREPQITREWRKSQYRPHQQAPLLQAIDKSCSIISADNKYTLVVDDKEDNDYIWGANFEGKNLVRYVFGHFKAICEDPNCLFIVVPDAPAKQIRSSKVTVKIIQVPTRLISYYSRDEIIFYDSEEMLQAWYVNTNSYLRFQKNGENEWMHADGRNGYYAHMFGYLPVHFGGGIWNSHGYYDSYIGAAIPFCDDYVGSNSAVQMVNKEASHPFIIASADDCPDCNGMGHYQYCNSCNCSTTDCTCNNASNYLLRTCMSCNGTKVKSQNPADWKVVPADQVDKKHIQLVNPDVSINKFLHDFNKDMYEGIRRALHQQYIDEAQSGTAKDIDREGERLWYQTCSNGMWYGLLEKILIDILSIRNISKSNGVIKPNIPKYTLIPPTDFDLKTEYDLLDEYKKSSEAQMPQYILQRQANAFVDKQFGGDEVMVKSSNIINYIDPYSTTTAADKAVYITNGVASADEIRFSNVLPTILNKIQFMWGKERYINASYEEIENECRTLFDKMPKPAQPKEETIVKEII